MIVNAETHNWTKRREGLILDHSVLNEISSSHSGVNAEEAERFLRTRGGR